jgi:hypothetical protein
MNNSGKLRTYRRLDCNVTVIKSVVCQCTYMIVMSEFRIFSEIRPGKQHKRIANFSGRATRCVALRSRGARANFVGNWALDSLSKRLRSLHTKLTWNTAAGLL